MSSLRRNKRVAGLEFVSICQDASKHRTTCEFLKCPSFSFRTYSSEALVVQFKTKHSSCQKIVIQGDGKHTQQSAKEGKIKTLKKKQKT